MTPREWVDLQGGNTLRLASQARYFSEPSSIEEVQEALAFARQAGVPVWVLGEGSNVVMAPRIDALVMRPANRGVRVCEQDNVSVLLEVEAGHNWDALVAHCVESGWYGLENLSLIPGSVGASPFQNIGAYGVELSDSFDSLDAVSLSDGTVATFSRQQCEFGYRDSVFKSAQAHRWLIMRVRLRLSLQFSPVLHYADLEQRFQALPDAEKNARGLRNLVISLRTAKLPDPAELPNAGSFFKNPVVSEKQAQALRERFDDLVCYPLDDGQCKLAAGWLIEKAGFKGQRDGALGMHAAQALVLVNHGHADAASVAAFASRVRDAVQTQFGVALEQEPVVFGAG